MNIFCLKKEVKNLFFCKFTGAFKNLVHQHFLFSLSFINLNLISNRKKIINIFFSFYLKTKQSSMYLKYYNLYLLETILFLETHKYINQVVDLEGNLILGYICEFIKNFTPLFGDFNIFLKYFLLIIIFSILYIMSTQISITISFRNLKKIKLIGL